VHSPPREGHPAEGLEGRASVTRKGERHREGVFSKRRAHLVFPGALRHGPKPCAGQELSDTNPKASLVLIVRDSKGLLPEDHGHRLPRKDEGEIKGEEIASFECRANSGGASWSGLIPGLLALYALVGSQSRSGLYALLAVLLISTLASLLPAFLAKTKARLIITQGGIRIQPLKSKDSQGRFLPWGKMSHFSSDPMGTKGGRIYLYPKGPFGALRRWVIETLNLFDYQLLYNQVYLRVSMF